MIIIQLLRLLLLLLLCLFCPIISEQDEHKKQLIEYDDFTWKFVPRAQFEQYLAEPSNDQNVLRYVGGVDISFGKDDATDAISSLVVLQYPDLQVVYKSFKRVTMTLPYIAGFLAFREVEHLLVLIDELRNDPVNSKFFPQVILVDGNGVLHQRGFGLASHMGVLANVPAIGVAKKLLFVDGITKETVAELTAKELKKAGDVALLRGNSGKVHGAIIKSTDDAKHPVFVSQGHKISAETTAAIVRDMCEFRIPEPTRQADLLSREQVRIQIDKSQQQEQKKISGSNKQKSKK